MFRRPYLLIVLMLAVFPVAGVAGAAQPEPSAVDRPGTFIKRATAGQVETIQRRARASFRFRGGKGTKRFKCRVDGQRWHYCRSPEKVWTGPGRHRFAVRAVGKRFAFDRSPAVRHWRVKRWQPHFFEARRYARRRTGRVSFAVDVGWRLQEVRGAQTARTASTIKAMLMAAYLSRRSVRHHHLSSSEKSLLGVMIRHSDNGAASTVRDMVGARAIKRLARRSGMRDFQYSPIWGICRTSARDQAHFMRNLKRFIPKRHWGFAKHQLASITPSQRWGFGDLDLRGWNLYFKGGWGISNGRYGGLVDHQIALLQRGRWRIGIAILTQGSSAGSYGNETLRGVAARLLRGLPH